MRSAHDDLRAIRRPWLRLEAWLADETLLAIAAENALSETAYIVREGGEYQIRWFTPTQEVPLCGHATLASAWVVFHRPSQSNARRVSFEERRLAGRSQRRATGSGFPGQHAGARASAGQRRIGRRARANPARACIRASSGFACTIPRSSASASARHGQHPCNRHSRGHRHGPGKDCDFVSRFFAPGRGRARRPGDRLVAHAPRAILAKKLGKSQFFARQVSARGGELWCELLGSGPQQQARLPGSGPHQQTRCRRSRTRAACASPARPRFSRGCYRRLAAVLFEQHDGGDSSCGAKQERRG